MKVLVADDDLVTRIMLQEAVTGLGHECLVAEDGDEAWASLVDASPNVLVTDRMMPGIDGIELCRRVRARRDTNYTYIILATSLAERDEILGGMQAGADDYLTKPLDPFDLETKLVAALRVTSLHAELRRSQAELARLACTDPLTQLRNRLSLGDDLRALHARSERYGHTYCVAMCDVDHFKSFNDAFGHQAGDEMLRSVAATMTTELRSGDALYRYGGEEFLLVLPEQAPASAVLAAERMRGAVQRQTSSSEAGTAGCVTISVGVAGCDIDRDSSADAVLNRADAALYQAKSEGRNRVVLLSARGV